MVENDSVGAVPFTPRQIEILEHLAAGRTDRSTAARLGISERQVRREIAAMITATGVQGRIPLVLHAHRRGMLISAST
jgi:DNA-binding NarL/FixJ family response regulator